MSRYGTRCSWGEPPCTVEFRAPSLYLLHQKALEHLQSEHADTPEEVAGFYVEWEDAAGVWHRLPAESVGREVVAVGAAVTEQGENPAPCDQIPADHIPTLSGLCAVCGRSQTEQGEAESR